jgi:hypothetical protein
MQTAIFRKPFLILSISLFTSFFAFAQQQDTTIKIVTRPVHLQALQEKKKYLSAKSLIIPTFFIEYGFSSLHVKQLQQLNKQVSEEVTEDMRGFRTILDDYMKNAPMVSVYALNLAGIKGRHKLIDHTIIYAMSSFLANHIVSKLKKATHQLRPDSSTYNSFPSGHTTTAFVGAEFMNQEFGWRSPWYSVAGYSMATGTAALRVMNNRHWVGDVIAGAGIGMLSTKFCYWLYSKWEYRKHGRLPIQY